MPHKSSVQEVRDSLADTSSRGSAECGKPLEPRRHQDLAFAILAQARCFKPVFDPKARAPGTQRGSPEDRPYTEWLGPSPASESTRAVPQDLLATLPAQAPRRMTATVVPAWPAPQESVTSVALLPLSVPLCMISHTGTARAAHLLLRGPQGRKTSFSLSNIQVLEISAPPWRYCCGVSPDVDQDLISRVRCFLPLQDLSCLMRVSSPELRTASDRCRRPEGSVG